MAPTYEIPSTVTVPSEMVIELLAAVRALGEAASNVIAYERGARLPAASETGFDEIVGRVACDLQDAIFGHVDDHDSEGNGARSPVEVAVLARASALEAELLEAHVRADEPHPLAERARRTRRHGELIAEARTIDVDFVGIA